MILLWQHTVNIDVVDKTIPIGNNRVIPVINQPNPALGYAASANEVAQLLRLANYYVYEAGTDTIINPYNYYDYFPEAGGGGGGGGGGVTPQTVQSMIDASIDSTVSDTSTKAVQNAAITNFVNSSIESSTAEFKGTYDSKVEMDAVTANQNDYAFLCVLNNDGSVNHYERYKWSDTEVSGSHWLFEYNVNNSSFTAEQWAAINSGVKDTDVSALGGHVNNTNNPHGVTKSQVGLSDVDNTSDADKPISTATQTALNTKFDTAGTGLDKNGTTVSHATPEGAATHAKAFYKFSTDALGHVNGVTEATEAEVDAIDSGITAAKVGQIETNKNNILSTAVYGTCDTAGATAAKIVDVQSGFVLRAGCVIGVRFANSNSASNVTLNVGNSGDKSIRLASTIYSGSRTNITGNAGYTIFYMYDGTYWCWISHGNQPLGMTAAEASTGTSTADRFISAKVLSDAIDERTQPLETNILTVADQSTQYNLINLHNPIAVRNVVPTYLSDGGVTLDVNNAKWTAFNIDYPSIVGVKYKFVVRITATTGLSNFAVYIRDTNGDGTNIAEYPYGISNSEINSVGTHVFEFTATATTMWIGFYPNNSSTAVTGSVTMKAQVIEKSLCDAGFTDYQPYALPNATITPALKECANNGAKNLLNFSGSTPIAPPNCTMTDNGDGTFTVTKTSANLDIPYIATQLKAGTYILSGCPAGGSDSTYRLDIRTSSGTAIGGEYGNGGEITIPSDGWYRITCRLNSTYTTTGLTIKPMLCDPALWAVSHTFEPYALPNTAITPVLKECVDNGVKNLLNIPDGSYTVTGLTVVAASGELTFTSTNATAHAIVVGTINLKAGTYVLSDRAGGGKGFDIRLLVDDDNVTKTVETAIFTLSADKTAEIRVYSYATITNQTIKPMLCLKSLYDADPTYQPYAMSNADLTPHTTNVVKNNFTATDWTKVDELAFEIPTGKIAEFSASATRDTNILVKGIAFVNDDTFSIDRVLAISENANENYYALAVHGIRSRKNFTSETVNVFVKYSAAPVSSSITCTYRFV